MLQRYVIVHFVDLANAPADFLAVDWPLHVTLLSNFTLTGSLGDFSQKIAEYCLSTPRFQATAGDAAQFGPSGQVAVTLIDEVDELRKIHCDLNDIALQFGAIYDEPHYMLENYRPHATHRLDVRLNKGDHLTIDTLTLVDMLPHGDGAARRIIKSFSLLAT